MRARKPQPADGGGALRLLPRRRRVGRWGVRTLPSRPEAGLRIQALLNVAYEQPGLLRSQTEDRMRAACSQRCSHWRLGMVGLDRNGSCALFCTRHLQQYRNAAQRRAPRTPHAFRRSPPLPAAAAGHALTSAALEGPQLRRQLLSRTLVAGAGKAIVGQLLPPLRQRRLLICQAGWVRQQTGGVEAPIVWPPRCHSLRRSIHKSAKAGVAHCRSYCRLASCAPM